MTENLLNLARCTRRKFSKHFLISVHGEIAFSGTGINTILSAESKLKTFFESKGYTISQKIFQKEVRMENEPDKSAKITQKETPLGLFFVSQKPRREIQILATKVLISSHLRLKSFAWVC